MIPPTRTLAGSVLDRGAGCDPQYPVEMGKVALIRIIKPVVVADDHSPMPAEGLPGKMIGDNQIPRFPGRALRPDHGRLDDEDLLCRSLDNLDGSSSATSMR